MKTFYTSNYARNANNPNAIGISFIVPSWYEGKTLAKLAPTSEMISKITGGSPKRITIEAYTEAYIDLLNERGITPDSLMDELPDGAILLCYESPGDFCHRRVLAEWFEDHTNIKIEEWLNEKELKSREQEKVVDSLVDF